MLLGYRIVVCVTRNNLYGDEEVFSFFLTFPGQDRIHEHRHKPRKYNICKQYLPICYLALIFLAAFHSFPVLPDCPSYLIYYSNTVLRSPFPHYSTPATANHTVDNLGCLHSHSSRPVWHLAPTTVKKIQQCWTKYGPRPTAPHWHEPTQHLHYTVMNRKTHITYMVLYHLHTHTHTHQHCVKEISCPYLHQYW